MNPAPSANGSAASPSGESQNKPRHFTLGGLIILIILAAAFGAAYYYLKLDNVLKVLFGLSFVIFIHELGHFAVAKMCDVHVTHFSIGFGPVIPGCSFVKGETTYQVCLLPLGGYVQMVGQVDGDESADGSEGDPRSYRNKSVGQRMAIISAGVVMNAILALICFIVIYRGPGKDRLAPVIAVVDGGGPAFKEGIRSGMVIEQIGDVKNPYFDDLKVMVAGSNYGEKLQIIAKRPEDKTALDIVIEPRKNKDDPNPVIGIVPASSLKLASLREVGGAGIVKTPTFPGTAAFQSKPAFDFEDVIIACTDPKDGKTVTELPEDPRKPGQKDYFEFSRRMQLLADKEVVIRVKRASGDVDITVPPAFRWSLGTRMEMGEIVSIRKGSPAAKAEIRVPDAVKAHQKGDLLQKVEVKDADGKPLVFEGATLDPERLPWHLKTWAQNLQAAKKDGSAYKVTLTMRRHREEAGAMFEPVTVDLLWDPDYAFDRSAPINALSPIAIPELGFGYQVRGIVAGTSDAKSLLQQGDVIKNVKVTAIDMNDKEKAGPWITKENLRPEEWAQVSLSQLNTPAKLLKFTLKVERDKEVKEIEIVPVIDSTWPILERGMILSQDLRRQKADTTLEAISLGIKDTQKSMGQILQNLRQMVTGRISWEKNLGGPISIARIAYQVAGYDIWEFIFFLGLISINLAVINFLPIPVLDGGHMVFLIYEKLRGKPASEGIRAAATYAGLAFILCLMLFVIWLDISRL